MKKKAKTFHLTVSHFKILETVYLLNDKKAYPNAKGLNNILKGQVDLYTKDYVDLPTFATLISFCGRKMCACVLNLIKRNYLVYIYDDSCDDMFLQITIKGKEALFRFKDYYNKPYSKKTRIEKPTIIKR